MAGDGVKTDRRSKSLRNKLVTVASAVSGAVVGIEQSAPGVLPVGTGAVVTQLAPFVILLLNNFVKK